MNAVGLDQVRRSGRSFTMKSAPACRVQRRTSRARCEHSAIVKFFLAKLKHSSPARGRLRDRPVEGRPALRAGQQDTEPHVRQGTPPTARSRMAFSNV